MFLKSNVLQFCRDVKREKQPSKKMVFCIVSRAEPLFSPGYLRAASSSQGTSKPSKAK